MGQQRAVARLEHAHGKLKHTGLPVDRVSSRADGRLLSNGWGSERNIMPARAGWPRVQATDMALVSVATAGHRLRLGHMVSAQAMGLPLVQSRQQWMGSRISCDDPVLRYRVRWQLPSLSCKLRASAPDSRFRYYRTNAAALQAKSKQLRQQHQSNRLASVCIGHSVSTL